MGKSPRLIVVPEGRAFDEAAAAEFARAVQAGVKTNDHAAVALAGGSTPRGMHRLLAQSPLSTALPWARVHLFWGDERVVPYTDDASNYGTAKQDLIGPLGLDPDQVHPMPVNGEPDALAADYEATLRAHFGKHIDRPPVLDLVCLGLGEDGHTASLFPGHPALYESRRWTMAVTGGRPHVPRLTLTVPVLNQARRIVFLVAGTAKAAIVKTVMNHPEAALPAHHIAPGAGSITWVLDRPAAGRL